MAKRKKGRWTVQEDEFLLTTHHLGADHVTAWHDAGRHYGAGFERLAKLTHSGARLAFERMMFQRILFASAAGHECLDVEAELRRWEHAQSVTLNRMGGE